MAIEDLDLEFEDENEKEKSDALEVDVDLSFSAHDDPANAGAKPASTPKVNPTNTVEINPDDILNQSNSAPSSQNISEDDITDPNLRIPKELQKSPTPKDSATPKDNKKQSAPKGDASSGQNVSDINEARIKAQQTASANTRAQVKPTNQVKPEAKNQPAATPKVEPTPMSQPQSNQAAQVNEVLMQELSYYREQVEKLRTDMDSMKEELFNAKKDSEIKIAVAQMKAELAVELQTNGQLMEQKVNQMLQRIVKRVPQLKGEAVTIKKAVQEYMEVVKKNSK